MKRSCEPDIYTKRFSFLILQINIWHSVDSDATDNLFSLNIYWHTRKEVGEELGKEKTKYKGKREKRVAYFICMH